MWENLQRDACSCEPSENGATVKLLPDPQWNGANHQLVLNKSTGATDWMQNRQIFITWRTEIYTTYKHNIGICIYIIMKLLRIESRNQSLSQV